MKARNYCFTLNNYTKEEEGDIKKIQFSYLIYGVEHGEVNSTPHLQGYIEFDIPTLFNTLKKINSRIHWEPRRGTQFQAITYCKKEGTFYEFGTPKRQGKRTDLDTVRSCAISDGLREVSAIYNLQQIRYAEKYLQYNEIARDDKPHVLWLYGSTGTGKSRKARELFKDTDFYVKNDGTKWYDGYDGHKNVIIDDFRSSWWSITEMLSLLDRYEKRVEFKGGSRQFLAQKIIVTSAFHPSDCYKCTGESIAQLLRRIDIIECLEKAQKSGGNTSPLTIDYEVIKDLEYI